jgi:nucleotide-binding universal stress UspA family protein
MTTRAPICVGVDASWQNSGALDWALREAQLRDLPVHAVHVVEDKQPNGPFFSGPGVGTAAKRLVADAEDYLAGHDETVGHSAGVLTGKPASTLVKAARSAEMLVVGRHGTGALTRLLIGSTAEAISHLSEGPVVIVPDRWQPQYAGAPVVVGVDEDEQTGSALEFAAQAAAERNAPLLLIRVWDLPAMYTWDAASITDQYDGWLEEKDQQLQAIADQWRLKYPKLTIVAETRRGHPVAGLIAAAEENKAELLVLGGRRHNRLASALLGSTARGVLHHAPCPVAVVHEPGDQN